MRFWTREVVGWILLALGLHVFYRSYTLLIDNSSRQIEGGILTIVGIFLFRGGIQLLRIAVAARACMEAQERLDRDRAKPGGLLAPSRPLAGRRSPPYAENRP
jgi:uncharacterized membrane protein YidH (DUF202 family)